MKWLAFALTAALISSVGCSGDAKTGEGKGGEKLTVDPPASVSVKQGATEKLKVTIKKEKFDDDVKLTFDKLPEGVKIAEDTTIKKGGTEANLTLEADKEARAQDGFKVKVTAEGGGIKTPPSEFTINVKENK